LLSVSDLLYADKDGWTALMLAAAKGHVDCVRILLPASEPFAVDNNGKSASDLAADAGHREVVRRIRRYAGAARVA
jgi:ankyrin repeat protein